MLGLTLNLPGSTTDLGQSQLDTPDLTLVAQTIFADELELSIPNPTLTNDVPDMKRSTLALSGLAGQSIRTDELTRKDVGGRCTSSSRNEGPWWMVLKFSRERLVVEVWVCEIQVGAKNRLSRNNFTPPTASKAAFGTCKNTNYDFTTKTHIALHDQQQWVTPRVSEPVRAMRSREDSRRRDT